MFDVNLATICYQFAYSATLFLLFLNFKLKEVDITVSIKGISWYCVLCIYDERSNGKIVSLRKYIFIIKHTHTYVFFSKFYLNQTSTIKKGKI